MSRRHFGCTDNAELRAKIDQAKRRRLPLPELLAKLGLGEHAKESAHCCFHDDEHKSFSVFHSKNGKGWQWKCFAGCGYGDEIAFLVKHFGISRQEAISRYLEMAGFPASAPPKSHEYPVFPEPHGSPECPGSHGYPVSPVSRGQALAEELTALGAHCVCTEPNTARKRRFKLARDVRAVEKAQGGELDIADLNIAFKEWHRLSEPFLDPAKTRDDYFAKFLGELRKVRVPTGEGETNKKALEAVSKLPSSELPAIPGMPDAPENWRRLAALHRELSRLSKGKTYFLSCRDAGKASPGMSHQTAWEINRALERLGVVKTVRVGDQHPEGNASEFRYLLPEAENGAAQAQ